MPRTSIKLSDEQIEQAFGDVGHLCDIDDIVFTAETIADFKNSRERWCEKGIIHCDNGKVLEIENAQTAKGQPPRWVVVIDFGDARGALVL